MYQGNRRYRGFIVPVYMIIALQGLIAAPCHAGEVTRNEILATLHHDDDVSSIVYNRDGTSIAFTDNSGRVYVLDINTSTIARIEHVTSASSITVRYNGKIRALAFSPDGSRLVSGGEDKIVFLWQRDHSGSWVPVRRGRYYGNNLIYEDAVYELNSEVCALDYRPQGDFWVSGNRDGTLSKGSETVAQHTGGVNTIHFIPDGSLLASGGEDGTVSIWNTDTWNNLITLTGESGRVTSVKFCPDGAFLAAGGGNGIIDVWSVGSWKKIASLKAHDDTQLNKEISSLDFNADGTLIASSYTGSKTVKLWSTKSWKLTASLDGHSEAVNSVAFNRQRKLIASGSLDNTVNIWRLGVDEDEYILRRHEGAVNSLAFSPDGALLASGSGDQTVKIWNVERYENTETLKLHSKGIRAVAFSPDGSLLASGGNDELIRLWKVADWKNTASLKSYDVGTRSISFHPEGRFVAAACGSNYCIKVWTAEGWEEVKTPCDCCPEIIQFDPSGSSLVAADGSTIRVLRTSDWKWTATKPNRSITEPINDFDMNGTLLAAAGSSGTIYIWDTKPWKVIEKLTGHSGAVSSVDFSPDGSLLASAGTDQTVKVWSTETWENTATYRDNLGSVHSVAFSPDGSHVASGDAYNITVRRVRPPKPQLPPELVLDVSFSDSTGNGILSAEEPGYIRAVIRNTGKGEAHQVIVSAEPKKRIDDLTFAGPQRIKTIKPDEKTELRIPVKAGTDIESKEVKVAVHAREYFGFDADPAGLTFMAEKLQPPDIDVTDYGIDDGNANGKIEASEVVTVKLRIANRGKGRADRVGAEVVFGDRDVTVVEPSSFGIGTIAPNEHKDVEFKFFTNKRYDKKNIPFSVILTEKRERFGKTEEIKLAFNKPEMTVGQVFAGGPEGGGRLEPLRVDVDTGIPETGMKNPDARAVVIGNRNYSADVPKVEYALRDAQVVKDYLIKTLGYREGHIIYIEDATLATLQSVFGTKDNPNGKLSNRIKKQESDVFIYYSGHGAPDRDRKEPYILPVDCDPNMVTLNAYPLSLLYENVAKLEAKSFLVVIDACFSGDSHAGPIERGISAPVIQIDAPTVVALGQRGVVFTSTDNEYPSCWYPEKKHGLFTYFFLKALRGEADYNKDKRLSIDEIHRYVSDENYGVPYQSKVLKDFEQKPMCIGVDKSRVLVVY